MRQHFLSRSPHVNELNVLRFPVSAMRERIAPSAVVCSLNPGLFGNLVPLLKPGRLTIELKPKSHLGAWPDGLSDEPPVFSRFRSRSCVGELKKEAALGSATKRNPIRRLAERFGWLAGDQQVRMFCNHSQYAPRTLLRRRNASSARLRRGAPALLPPLQLSRRAMQPAAARQNGLGRGQPRQGFSDAK